MQSQTLVAQLGTPDVLAQIDLALRARGKRRFVVTTDSEHNLPLAANLLQRDFSAEAPDLKWTSDITYIETAEGWLYLTAILDLHSRQVVGWSTQPHMQTSLITNALRMAWFRRQSAPGLILHSDRDSPILQPGIPVRVERRRHVLVDESQGCLLGQCAHGKPMGPAESRQTPWAQVRHAPTGEG